MAPSSKTNVQWGLRVRASSPTTQQQPTRVRERRETRRSNTLSLSSHDHKIPIDCPLPRCNARTVHQHSKDLQFFNPHPANEIQYRGYMNSHRVALSQAHLTTEGLEMQSQEMFEPELSDEEAVHEQHKHRQISVPEGYETGDQEEPIERRTLVITLKVAAPEDRILAPDSVASADLWKEQRKVVIPDAVGPEEHTMMDDGIFYRSPGDRITSRRTLDFVEDLLTPLQTIPMEIDYETVANALDSRGVLEKPLESPLTMPPGLQVEFDEWFVPKTPEQASETLPWDMQSSSHPLHDPSQEYGGGKVSSEMRCSPPEPYLGSAQVVEGDDIDFESIFGHTGKD